MANAKASESRVAKVARLEKQLLVVDVIGTSPLLMHRFSEKAKRMMADKQQKKSPSAKKAKDQAQECRDATYFMDDGQTPALPALSFKLAAVNACRYAGLKMTDAVGAFFVNGTYVEREGQEMVPLSYGEMVEREDVVRLAGKTADLRYRPEFRNWSVRLEATVFPNALSVEEFLTLLALAGEHVGVGDWRPQRRGTFGRFRIASSSPQKE